MPNRIIPILDRLRQDIAAGLLPRPSKPPRRQAGHSWRKRTPRPGHHHLPLPPPGPPRQHRLQPRRPLRRLDLHRHRLLPGPQAAAAGRLPPAPRANRRGSAGRHRRHLATGSGIGSGSSTAPGFSMPDTPERCKRTSASPATRRAAASPWPSGWRCSTWPPGCCSARRRRRCGPTRCRRPRRSPTGWSPATSCWGTEDSARMPIWPLLSPRPARRVPHASAADRRLHPRPPARRGEGRAGAARRACRARGGCWRTAIRIRSWSGTSPGVSRRG